MAARQSILLRAPQGEVGWTIIELQGSICCRGGSLDSVSWGSFHAEKDEPPKLVIGKQCMAGRWVKLKRPLAVMLQQAGEGTRHEYHVTGVVRHKLVFADRPDPVVTAPAPMAGPSKRARLPPESVSAEAEGISMPPECELEVARRSDSQPEEVKL
ncbi:hypothetical protein AB1Y20_017780 [Prymnesium parvum]|uniref:Uncharacterized protein n=1 Tax=Prymnesium parvum TaxID=97485 RepID=A0AB34JL76_PRYPA